MLGLSKAKLLNGAAVASVEEILVDVFNRYLKGEKYLVDLFLVVYLKNKVDLEYMLERASEAGIKTEILNFLETIDFKRRVGRGDIPFKHGFIPENQRPIFKEEIQVKTQETL